MATEKGQFQLYTSAQEAEGGAATNSGYIDTVLTACFHGQESLRELHADELA